MAMLQLRQYMDVVIHYRGEEAQELCIRCISHVLRVYCLCVSRTIPVSGFLYLRNKVLHVIH